MFLPVIRLVEPNPVPRPHLERKHPPSARLGSATMRIALILLGCLLGFVGVHILHIDQEYGLPWLMIAVATLAAVYGFRWGLVAAAAAVALDGLLRTSEQLAWTTLVLLISVVIADMVGRDLRRTYRRQKEASTQLSLLVAALEELSGRASSAAVLEALPGLLGQHGEGHVSVWRPEPEGMRLVSAVGFEAAHLNLLPQSGVVGRCARDSQPIHIADVRFEESYITAPNSDILSELALPLFERGEVVAVLNLERSAPFSTRELDGLEHFAKVVSIQLTQFSERSEIQFLNQLSTSLDSASTPAGVAQRGLALLVQAMEVDFGVVLLQQGDRMLALSSYGQVSEAIKEVFRQGIPYGQGLSWEVYATGRPIYSQAYAQSPHSLTPYQHEVGAMVVHPVSLPQQARPRVILALGKQTPRLWREAEQDTLAAACRTLGLALDGALAAEQRDILIALSREAAEAGAELVYQKILEAAVRLVPGAEAGSLLVREGASFRFRATLGYDPSLMELSFSEAEQFRWYAGSLKDWGQGEPRIISSAKTGLSELSAASREVLQEAGRVEEIQANLALPVIYRGEVLALLYLDNLHDAMAFDEDSLEVARFFAAPIAALLHEVRYRGLLEQVALTDALTNLPNRRAFDRRLGEELERAQRYGQTLSLLVMDLRGFKRINDQLGHAKGDEALVRVAEALQRIKRDGDTLYRWGGDEFAAILPHTELPGATTAAQRYAETIGKIVIDGFEIGVNIGAASYPGEASKHDGLLRLADTRMYEAKSQGVAVVKPAPR